MKVLTDTTLGYLVQKIKALIPGLASQQGAGLLRALSGKEDEVLLGTGEWGAYHGGGGAGLLSFEVQNGHLYEYYDDGLGEPGIALETDGALAGHITWTYDNGA